MEPNSIEKLEALREHIRTLNEQLDDLRLEYDVCEKRERRKFLEEIGRLVSVVDPLTCDLLTMEENSFVEDEAFPQQKPRVFVREEEVVLNETKVGSLVMDDEGTVYKVTFCGEFADYLERQTMLTDPLRWTSADGKTLCFKKKPWKVVEFLVPVGTEITEGFRYEGSLSPHWLGKLVQKNGKVYKLLREIRGEASWRLVEVRYDGNGKLVDGEFYLVSKESTGWELFDPEGKGKEKIQ
nr:hypothetical protein MarFTME_016 [Marseillevirus futianmevirus]